MVRAGSLRLHRSTVAGLSDRVIGCPKFGFFPPEVACAGTSPIGLSKALKERVASRSRDPRLGDAATFEQSMLNASCLEPIKEKDPGAFSEDRGLVCLAVRREGCSRPDPNPIAIVAVRSYCSVPCRRL